MESAEKLGILAAAARYDASCASSGSSGGGAALPAGVCHSWTGDGRCVSLLKILYSNACSYDCAYCVNRKSNDTRRVSFSPSEIADITMDFWIRNYIEGLFLSSGIFSDPDHVMGKLVDTARLLRKERGFRGYIHLKIIPGASEALIRAAGLYADRLSANIELPSGNSLRQLAPDKDGKAILNTIKDIGGKILEREEDKTRLASTPAFAPAGQSTQLIVGASPEPDKTILRLSESLYSKARLKRVYYSAYLAAGKPIAGAMAKPPLVREHRLYQADWLLRFYRFTVDEIVDDDRPDLDLELDPKCSWALRHPEFFPVDLATADYETILRVPGIGVMGAQKIIAARRSTPLTFDSIARMRIAMKRARYFILIRGKRLDSFDNPDALAFRLKDRLPPGTTVPGKTWNQYELPFTFDRAV